MATVNKPILLDETGKDIASAVREQTQALKTAIQSISVGGGSGGGGDDGYFPSNVDVTLSGSEFEISQLSNGGYVFYYKVYDPATSPHEPFKYIFSLGSGTANLTTMTVTSDSFEEVLEVLNSVDAFMGLLASGTASFGMMTPTTVQGVAACLGTIKCVEATDKPLWFLCLSSGFEENAIPYFGFY